jgi:hypothetical protein
MPPQPDIKLRCPRCPGPLERKANKHHRYHNGLQVCKEEDCINFLIADLWPQVPIDYIDQSDNEEELNNLKDRLAQKDDDAKELAKELLIAAFLDHELYDGIPMVKELLEEAIDVFFFPEDFIEEVRERKEEEWLETVGQEDQIEKPGGLGGPGDETPPKARRSCVVS